jgi:hypothetical protein
LAAALKQGAALVHPLAHAAGLLSIFRSSISLSYDIAEKVFTPFYKAADAMISIRYWLFFAHNCREEAVILFENGQVGE